MTLFLLLAGSGLAAVVQSMTLKVSGHGGSVRGPKGAPSPGRSDGHAPARRPTPDDPFILPDPSSSSMDKRHD